MSEKQVKLIILEILLGLHFIHSNGIIHRDLKPENILLSGNSLEISICDFGFALDTKNKEYMAAKNVCGTPGYIAPEVYKE